MELEIGQRLARLRLARNVRQAALAEKAGIGVRTLRRLESGEPSTLDTFLRVATELDLEGAILSALPEWDVRPIERVSKKGSEERTTINGLVSAVSTGRVTKKGNERRRASPASKRPAKSMWTWGNEAGD